MSAFSFFRNICYELFSLKTIYYNHNISCATLNNKIFYKKEILTMKKYVCEPCGYEYDPAVGDPDNGIAPGTAFEDLPDDWVCPICGLGKDVFVSED